MCVGLEDQGVGRFGGGEQTLSMPRASVWFGRFGVVRGLVREQRFSSEGWDENVVEYRTYEQL